MSFYLKRKHTKKPANPEWDFSHPIVKNATSLLSLTNRGALPYDESEKSFWTADTTNDTVEYKYQPVDGSIQFARQDIDESGISYYAAATGIDTNVNPVFLILVYTVLAAPSGASIGIAQLADVARNGNPMWLYTSESATTLRFYASGAYAFTGIPTKVGERNFIIYKFDGIDKHDFYSSAKGIWETYIAAPTQGLAADKFWLGSGYNAELPCAFEMLAGAVGYAPSLSECKALAKNPYQLFKYKKKFIPVITTATIGFQSAWVAQATITMGFK